MTLSAKLRYKAQSAWIATLSLDALGARLAKRRGVLGLCYHAFCDELEGYPYRTSPEAFEAQLTFLGEIYEIVSVSRAVELLETGGAENNERPLAMICFDDGYRCNWTEATPILERHKAPATLFAARDLIRRSGPTYMDEETLVRLSAHPLWEVGGHGISHNVLTGLRPDDQHWEVAQSAAWLDELLGQGHRGFAYPQGQFNAPIAQIARAHFAYGLATDLQHASVPGLYQVRRFCPMRIHDDLTSFARALVVASME